VWWKVAHGTDPPTSRHPGVGYHAHGFTCEVPGPPLLAPASDLRKPDLPLRFYPSRAAVRRNSRGGRACPVRQARGNSSINHCCRGCYGAPHPPRPVEGRGPTTARHLTDGRMDRDEERRQLRDLRQRGL
jgi:hypothetical protein